MADLVDIVIPANAQAAAEALGLKVHRSVTSGARVRGTSAMWIRLGVPFRHGE